MHEKLESLTFNFLNDANETPSQFNGMVCLGWGSREICYFAFKKLTIP